MLYGRDARPIQNKICDPQDGMERRNCDDGLVWDDVEWAMVDQICYKLRGRHGLVWVGIEMYVGCSGRE